MPRNPSNLHDRDYRSEAGRMAMLEHGIVDAHAHVNGARAARLLREAMDLYGVTHVWSMTALEQVPQIQEVLGDRLRLIAVPDFGGKDRRHAHGAGFLDRIRAYHGHGARICKFWAAPRITDYAIEAGDPSMFRLDSPLRIEAMELAASLGMAFMTHVADPDTWFATRYADHARYGRKAEHYEPLERLLKRFGVPWIAAHMGGWPENLEFLDGLLERHANLHLDASATKWMVRELSRHPRQRLVDFLARHRGRVLFGSDIVTTDDHLAPAPDKTEMAAKASAPEDAFDLYASRYWALRTLWESDHDGPSPIADPDLALVHPDRHGPMDAPRLRGKRLPGDLLRSLYRDAAVAFESRITSAGSTMAASKA
ncbi:MAG: hypothetical protein ACO32J_02865 [Phycisphaerales bacterium]